MTPALDLIGGPQAEHTYTETPAQRRFLLAAMCVSMAMTAGGLSWRVNQKMTDHRVETTIVQPALNACQPADAPTQALYASRGVNTNLAAYVLIKNPGKVKELCAVINQSLLEATRVSTPFDRHRTGYWTLPNGNAELNNLATSLGVDPSLFQHGRTTPTHSQLVLVDQAATENPVFGASSPNP